MAVSTEESESMERKTTSGNESPVPLAECNENDVTMDDAEPEKAHDAAGEKKGDGQAEGTKQDGNEGTKKIRRVQPTVVAPLSR